MRTTARAIRTPQGLHAAIAARAGLEQLSRERVRMELMKLLLAPHAVPVLAVMAEAGLLGSVLGGVPHLASFANMAKVEAAVGLAPDATRRLGALGVWVAEDAERLWQRLRLSNAEHERLAALDGWWRVSPAMSEASARELIYRIGAEHFTERVLLAWARSWDGARNAEWHVLATLPRRWSAPAFPLKAADFIARGVEKGPSLGAALARAEEAWIKSGFPMEQARVERDHQRCAGWIACHPGRAQREPGSITTVLTTSLDPCLWVPGLPFRSLARDDSHRYSAACMVATSSAPACMVAATSR